MSSILRTLFLGLFLFIFSHPVLAAPPTQFVLDVSSFKQPIQFSSTVSMLLALSAISLVPFFLISTTGFVRIVIVLGMIRGAIGTQQSPPNPVIIALAMFMTLYVMMPVWNEVKTKGIDPYDKGLITQQQMFDRSLVPIKDFMLKCTREKDLALFVEFSKIQNIKTRKDVPMFVLIPAFMISELKTAFQIGFLLYLPFVVIDLVVSNILLSLGMFMLSPVMVSMPFKILLFVITDGWNLITRGLILSFQ